MSVGSSGSYNSSRSSSDDRVWEGQTPFLGGLYSRAYNASLGLGSGGQMLNSNGKSRGNIYQDPLQQLGGSLTQQGQGMLGQLGMLGQSGNPFAQAQIGQLGQGLGRLFNQQIAPGINSQFAQGGTLGGSRQALALGQAGEGLGQAFTSGALDILGNSSQLALQANQAGLGGLGQVAQAGQFGQFGSLPGLASLLGNPVVLNSNDSKSLGGSTSFNIGF